MDGSEISTHSSDGAVKSRTRPFDPAALPFDPRTHTAVEVSPSDQLFPLVISHLGKHGVIVEEDAVSFQMARSEKSGASKGGCCGGGGGGAAEEESLPGVAVSLGLGLFRFGHRGQQLKALHQHIGDPVGCGCGAQVLSSLVLFAEGTGEAAKGVVQRFLADVLAESEKTGKNTFQVYRWHMKFQFWQRVGKVRARPVSSVVLPEETSRSLLDDITEFLSEEAAQFYQDHGIPYKRSYLFHGVPGSGKTSMIQALAGKFGRNLCYLSPTHPELSDDSLKSAIERVPDNAIVVLEDVDALFGKNREKKIHQSPLTFSGLLNALDGVGNHDGMIFVLTTNFKEQLDAALIRDGRVDLRVRFDYCTPTQMEKMFDNFFGGPPAPLDDEVASAKGEGAAAGAGDAESDPEILALEAKLTALRREKAAKGGAAGEPARPTGAAFRDALLVSLGERRLTTAQLQHFMVTHRKCSAAEAIADVGAIAAALDERAKEEAGKDAADAGEEEEAKDDKEKAGAKRRERAVGKEATGAGPGGAVHVHIHAGEK